ncbi:MAG: hypothetical protein M3326_00155 [Actinomycetota bacterium]|nr:hypothetical protein [Actinomycetota bacterium]
MTGALALVSLLLGVVYTCYGVITVIDMKEGWRTRGFSHFGAAWITMAFTCGPHHFEHGLHLAFAGRPPGPLEFVTVVAGLPAGAIWFLLRVEAVAGGRGDRFVAGTPPWVAALPWLAAAYLGAVVVFTGALLLGGGTFRPTMVPNIILIGLYMTIGWHLLVAQLQAREPRGGWSVSGLALTFVFPTCAVMHGVWVLYAFLGKYDVDVHGLVIDWLSVPASFYFLWVVRSLQLGTGTDWNEDVPSIAMPERNPSSVGVDVEPAVS